MCQPWLTTIDCPVSAVVGKADSMRVTSAMSAAVVNCLSTVSRSITSPTTCASEMPSALACSGICLSTSGVRTNPGQTTLARTPCLAPSLATVRQRRDIGRLQWRGLAAVDRAHVDDRAAALPVHVLEACLGGEKGPIEMDSQ